MNLWVLDHASIKFNSFPIGHVAGAVSASLAIMGLMLTAGACCTAIAIGISMGSVRGRYHYTADVVLGVVVAVGASVGSVLV